MSQYVYGKSVIYSLLQSNREVERLFLQAGKNDAQIAKLAQQRHLSIERLTRNELDRLVSGNHQGYVALTREYPVYTIKEVLQDIPQGKKGLLVALDGIQDPHNLGAVLRTAACVGADGVIIEKDRSVSLNSTVAKVSVGAIDKVKTAVVTNLSQTLRSLKDEGFWIIGTDVNKASDYRSVDYDMPVVLVIGSEGKGMRRLVRESCDILVRLPMESEMDSLNASVATGILLYEIYGQRFPLKQD